ncbi:hypothetical protein FRC09_000732, partial [Ceratobasidium sp. 395]
IGRTRQLLQERITRHVGNSASFYSPEQTALHVLPASLNVDPAHQGKPEHTHLALPSRLPTLSKSPVSDDNETLLELERTIRRTCCLEALARVRTTSQQKALMLTHKEKNLRGEVKNTRFQTMVDRLTKRVDLAIWEYKNSRKALLALGATEKDTARLRPLTDKDTSGLTSMLQGDRSTGEGKRQLPWFWAVRSMEVGEYDDTLEECDDGK